MRFRRLLALLAATGFILACAGCASPQQDESDLPWNMPQSWESAPSLPGNMGGGY